MKLQPFAEMDIVPGFGPGSSQAKGHFWKLVKLGAGDGIGVLLKLASFCDHATGEVRPEDVARFTHESEPVIELLQASTLNSTVLNSLMLTVLAALTVLHAGGNAYAIEQKAVGMRMGDASSGYLGWADLATFCWPEDPLAQESLRRVLYVCECGALGFGMLMCALGLWLSLFFYIAISTGLPNTVAKCEYIVRDPQPAGTASALFFGQSLVGLLLALPFITARSSAIAFFCSTTVAAGWFFFDMYTFGASKGQVVALMAAQNREARLILGSAGRIRNGAEPNEALSSSVEAREVAHHDA